MASASRLSVAALVELLPLDGTSVYWEVGDSEPPWEESLGAFSVPPVSSTTHPGVSVSGGGSTTSGKGPSVIGMGGDSIVNSVMTGGTVDGLSVAGVLCVELPSRRVVRLENITGVILSSGLSVLISSCSWYSFGFPAASTSPAALPEVDLTSSVATRANAVTMQKMISPITKQATVLGPIFLGAVADSSMDFQWLPLTIISSSAPPLTLWVPVFTLGLEGAADDQCSAVSRSDDAGDPDSEPCDTDPVSTGTNARSDATPEGHVSWYG